MIQRFKMNHEHLFVAVSGPTGIGKSTTAKLIAENLGYHLLEENFTENPFLDRASEDSDHYALPSQIFFLMEKRKQYMIAQQLLKETGVVQDTPIQQDVYSYARTLLHGPQWDEYLTLYHIFEEQLIKPSLIICLEADAAVNMERIRQRKGRDFERRYTPKYIKSLTGSNHEWIRNSGIPAVYIETDHLDIVNSTEAKKSMMGQIRDKLKSMHYQL